MDVAAFIARIRDHYVDQFLSFAERQRSGCAKGAQEVKLRLSEPSVLFEGLYCADFIKNDGSPQVVALQPETILTFEPITSCIGRASPSFDHLRWDDVVIHHDADTLGDKQLCRWFRQWFDPDEVRHDSRSDLSGVVHSMLVEPHSVSIDFGTADPAALWEMLELIERAGAKRIRVSTSKAEPADAGS